MLFLSACVSLGAGAGPKGLETADPLEAPVDSAEGSETAGTDTVTGDSVDTDSGGADSRGGDPPSECASLRPAPWEAEARHPVLYWEDFAFDDDGSMITIDGDSVIKQWLDGTTHVVYPHFGDSRGHLPLDGDRYVIASFDTASLDIIGDDGSREHLATSGNILAITIDDEGWTYFADASLGKIGRVNVETREEQTVTEALAYPDGIAWDSVGDQLYAVENEPGQLTVIPYDRATEAFAEPEVVATVDDGAWLDGVAVDVCGNVYVVDSRSGLYRYQPDGGVMERLVEFPPGVYTPSVHFGEGYGDFERDHLFVMDYDGSQLFEYDAQVEGRPNPWLGG